jgi:DNA modification methylase
MPLECLDRETLVYPDNFINKVICGDSLELMKLIPAEAVELIFTDPPYAISNEVVITRGRNKMKFKGKDISQDFGDWDKFNSLDEFMDWTFKWLDEAVRILRGGGMLCSYFDRDKVNFISRYLQDKYGFKCKGYYADLKSNPVPQARKVKWMNGWEIIGMWQKPGGKLTYNYQLGQAKDWGVRAIVGHTTKEDGERIHPTQKPISIAKKFVSYWSNKDDIVLDPFMGTGFVLIACKELNRRFIGIEKDTRYCQKAERRLMNTIGSLF